MVIQKNKIVKIKCRSLRLFVSIVVHGGIEDTSPRRPRPGTGKGQGLDVKRIIAVLKPCELYGDGESCHVVFLRS